MEVDQLKKPVFEPESFPVFRNLSDDGKALLKRGLHLKVYSSKTTIVEKGQAVSGAFFVAKGKLRVFTITPDGNEATLYFIKPDEFCVFTLKCIFNDLPYPAWVQTETETLIGLIPSADCSLLMTQSEIAGHLGTTREVVARALRRFVMSDQIETRRGKIIIKRPTEFARLI